jgi:CRP-like cAMP-binding protein
LFHGGQYEHLLARAPMLSTLPPEILDAIMATGKERSYEPEHAVVREGEPGDELFVILEGEARIERGGNVLATFGPGEFFGEIAVLDGRPRSADVVAVTTLRCLTVSREVLRDALESEPKAAWAMLQILAGRLRDD